MLRILAVLLFMFLPAGFVFGAYQDMGESPNGFLTSLPPDAPELDSPGDNAAGFQHAVTVSWHSQIHSASYTLQVSSAPDFSALVIQETSLTDTLKTASGLEGNTTYYWRVSASNVAGEGEFSEVWSFTTASYTGVEEDPGSIPDSYALLPAFPNPFNPTTTILYHLPEEAYVSIVIFNSLARSVQELVSGHRPPGEHTITWDGRDSSGAPVASGLYICRFKTGGRVFTQKLYLVR